jgi:hypothetical protein
MYMNKIIVTALLCAIATLSIAQNEAEINVKNQELKELETILADVQKNIEGKKGEIKALQPVVHWEKGGFQAANLNQVALQNWSKGGVSSSSLTLLANYFANYKSDDLTWENNLNLAYGLLKNKDEVLRKNEDKIDFSTKLGKKATPKINYAILGRLESQFAPGYDFADPDSSRPVISKIFAPAFLKLSLGIDFRPNKQLSLFISPASGKYTFVMDDSIAAMNLYIPTTSKNNRVRAEFGALVSAIYANPKLSKSIGIRSTLELFNNFTDPNTQNRKNIDVDWQTMFVIKLGKYLGANVFAHLVYDDDIKIEVDPEQSPGKKSAVLQVKEVFGIGFSYKF